MKVYDTRLPTPSRQPSRVRDYDAERRRIVDFGERVALEEMKRMQEKARREERCRTTTRRAKREVAASPYIPLSCESSDRFQEGKDDEEKFTARVRERKRRAHLNRIKCNCEADSLHQEGPCEACRDQRGASDEEEAYADWLRTLRLDRKTQTLEIPITEETLNEIDVIANELDIPYVAEMDPQFEPMMDFVYERKTVGPLDQCLSCQDMATRARANHGPSYCVAPIDDCFCEDEHYKERLSEEVVDDNDLPRDTALHIFRDADDIKLRELNMEGKSHKRPRIQTTGEDECAEQDMHDPIVTLDGSIPERLSSTRPLPKPRTRRKNRPTGFGARDFQSREEVVDLILKAISRTKKTDRTEYSPSELESWRRVLMTVMVDQRQVDSGEVAKSYVTNVEHVIRIKPGVAPQAEPARQLAGDAKIFAVDTVRKLLEHLIISPTNSEWAAPLVIVRQKGKFRLCIDYRRLNSVTVRDRYPMPAVEDCVQEAASHRYKCVVDLVQGYWQIPMAADSKELTAFIVPRLGAFMWHRMGFGLANAPSTFQRFADELCEHLQKVLPFIDDLFTGGDSMEELLENFLALMQRCEERGVKIKAEKCQLFLEEVDYLGFVVGDGVFHAKESMVKDIEDLPRPMTARQIKSVLGKFGFLRLALPDFAMIARPIMELAHLTAPKIRDGWSPDCETAWRKLKSLAAQKITLNCIRPRQHLVVETDASQMGAGAILRNEHGICAFYSKAYDVTQQAYNTTEREALAVVLAFQKWRHYLEAAGAITLITDHAALLYMFSSVASPKLYRWSTFISMFCPITVIHQPGQDLVWPDYLSRTTAPEQITIADGVPVRLLHEIIAAAAGLTVQLSRHLHSAETKELIQHEVRRWAEARRHHARSTERKTGEGPEVQRLKLKALQALAPETKVALNSLELSTHQCTDQAPRDGDTWSLEEIFKLTRDSVRQSKFGPRINYSHCCPTGTPAHRDTHGARLSCCTPRVELERLPLWGALLKKCAVQMPTGEQRYLRDELRQELRKPEYVAMRPLLREEGQHDCDRNPGCPRCEITIYIGVALALREAARILIGCTTTGQPRCVIPLWAYDLPQHRQALPHHLPVARHRPDTVQAVVGQRGDQWQWGDPTPLEVRRRLVDAIHIATGHHGPEGMLRTLQRLTCWPRMAKEIAGYRCLECTYAKGAGLVPVKYTAEAIGKDKQLFNQLVSTDVYDPCVRAAGGEYAKILIQIDAASRRSRLTPIRSERVQDLRPSFEEWGRSYGVPTLVRSDRGASLMAAVEEAYGATWRNMDSELGEVGIQPTLGWTPWSNGISERHGRELTSALSIRCGDDPQQWTTLLGDVEQKLNLRVRAATGRTPYEDASAHLTAKDGGSVPVVETDEQKNLTRWREEDLLSKMKPIEDAVRGAMQGARIAMTSEPLVLSSGVRRPRTRLAVTRNGPVPQTNMVVFIKTPHLRRRTMPLRKFHFPFLGPFIVRRCTQWSVQMTTWWGTGNIEAHRVHVYTPTIAVPPPDWMLCRELSASDSAAAAPLLYMDEFVKYVRKCFTVVDSLSMNDVFIDLLHLERKSGIRLLRVIGVSVDLSVTDEVKDGLTTYKPRSQIRNQSDEPTYVCSVLTTTAISGRWRTSTERRKDYRVLTIARRTRQQLLGWKYRPVILLNCRLTPMVQHVCICLFATTKATMGCRWPAKLKTGVAPDEDWLPQCSKEHCRSPPAWTTDTTVDMFTCLDPYAPKKGRDWDREVDQIVSAEKKEELHAEDAEYAAQEAEYQWQEEEPSLQSSADLVWRAIGRAPMTGEPTRSGRTPRMPARFEGGLAALCHQGAADADLWAQAHSIRSMHTRSADCLGPRGVYTDVSFEEQDSMLAEAAIVEAPLDPYTVKLEMQDAVDAVYREYCVREAYSPVPRLGTSPRASDRSVSPRGDEDFSGSGSPSELSAEYSPDRARRRGSDSESDGW